MSFLQHNKFSIVVILYPMCFSNICPKGKTHLDMLGELCVVYPCEFSMKEHLQESQGTPNFVKIESQSW